MLTDHTLNKWAELLDERAFWEGPTTLERYELAELHSMARELIQVRRTAATVIEQQAEIERLRTAAAQLLDNYGFCSDGSDHYREVPVKDIEALSAALGATQ